MPSVLTFTAFLLWEEGGGGGGGLITKFNLQTGGLLELLRYQTEALTSDRSVNASRPKFDISRKDRTFRG